MVLSEVRRSSTLTICGRKFSTSFILGNSESAIKNIITNIEGSKRDRKKIIKELHGEVKLKEYQTIKRESFQRYEETFLKPSVKWSKLIAQDYKLTDYSKASLAEVLQQKNFKLNATDLFKPLDVGDAVELSDSLNQSSLSVVVEVPPNDNDPRFTVMNKLGELSWIEKSAVKFRIPRLIPKEWLKDIVHRVEDHIEDHGSTKTTQFGFERYSVNPLARQFIVKPLVNITNRAWIQLQENSRKLEFLHRLLQTDGPREVSIFTLLKAMNFLDLESTKTIFAENKSIKQSYDQISTLLSNELGNEFKLKYGELVPGKEFEKLKSDTPFDASTFYSLVLTLRKQARLWTSTYSSASTLVPLSITVLPIQYINRVDESVRAIKLDPSYAKTFHKYVRQKDYTTVPQHVYPSLFLLKEYATGNLTDAKAITLVCQLMKVHTSQDINKSIVYDLLVKTKFIDDHLTNPMHYSTSLCLPNKEVSNKATIEQQYVEAVDVTKEREDDLALSRVEYPDLRVYCIDSETAHEIDDGVSVKKVNDDQFILYIHVADPASYMAKDSLLTKIAYERASTIYQPEVVIPMLPKSLADLAGLGNDNQKTRALTFSVPYNKATNTIDMEKARVEATNLYKFPKYTYEDVDKTLKDLNKTNPEHQELKTLFEISKKLREGRIEKGAIIFGESISSQVRVSESPKVENDSVGSETDINVVIDLQRETNSVILVSELMILGNQVAAQILTENKINGIFKGMEKLSLSDSTQTFIERMNQRLLKTSELPKISDILKLFKFITPAYYTSSAKRHLLLGVDQYAPSTSPLRRFGDLINHFGFHQYLNKKPQLFSEEESFAIALHMEAKNDILKKANRKSGAYYSISELEKNLDDTELGRFIVSTRAVNGSVYGHFEKYKVSARMELLKHRKPPGIGEILTSFNIQRVDKVGGSVLLKEL